MICIWFDYDRNWLDFDWLILMELWWLLVEFGLIWLLELGDFDWLIVVE